MCLVVTFKNLHKIETDIVLNRQLFLIFVNCSGQEHITNFFQILTYPYAIIFHNKT